MSATSSTPKSPPAVERLNALIGRLANEVANTTPRSKQEDVALLVLANCESALVDAIGILDPPWVEAEKTADEIESKKNNDALFAEMFPGSTPPADNAVDLADADQTADPEAEQRAEYDRAYDAIHEGRS